MQLMGVLQELWDVKTALGEGGDPMTLPHPNPTRDCRWDCQFFSICSMIDDGSNVETAIEDQSSRTIRMLTTETRIKMTRHRKKVIR